MGVLMEEKQGYTAAFDRVTFELLSGHQSLLEYVKGLQEQRDKLNQKIRSKDNRASASEFDRDL